MSLNTFSTKFWFGLETTCRNPRWTVKRRLDNKICWQPSRD